MSRAGYSDDFEGGELNVWRGAVKSAIRGKRGQAFLKELAAAMDAMPDKRQRLGALYDEANKGEGATLCENDLYGFNLDQLDPMAVAQNLCCEVEKMMGIYPNVPSLNFDGATP